MAVTPAHAGGDVSGQLVTWSGAALVGVEGEVKLLEDEEVVAVEGTASDGSFLIESVPSGIYELEGASLDDSLVGTCDHPLDLRPEPAAASCVIVLDD
ncbi:MAG: hypothetical protein H6739_10455 [Alphaproteobacteria bacterium]|nr:hypothetical protein [Alphaproteobacteria bacterium]